MLWLALGWALAPASLLRQAHRRAVRLPAPLERHAAHRVVHHAQHAAERAAQHAAVHAAAHGRHDAQASSALVKLLAADAPAGVDWSAPREEFVPECVGVVWVQYEEYLPLGAIQEVCEEKAMGTQGCHQWADKLIAEFHKPEPNYQLWCERFYDWFYEKFSYACLDHCERDACAPLCEHRDALEKIERERQALVPDHEAVQQGNQTVDALGQELEVAQRGVQRATEALNRSHAQLDNFEAAGDKAADELTAAAARAANRTGQQTVAQAVAQQEALAVTNAEMAALNADQQVEMAEQQLQQAQQEAARLREGPLKRQLDAAATGREDLAALKDAQQQAKQELLREQTDLETQTAQNAIAREDADALVKKTREALSWAEEKIAKQQQAADELSQRLTDPDTEQFKRYELQSRLRSTEREISQTVIELNTAKQKYQGAVIAEQVVSDAESATAKQQRKVPLMEQRIASRAEQLVRDGLELNRTGPLVEQAELDVAQANQLVADRLQARDDKVAAAITAQEIVRNATLRERRAQATLAAADAALQDETQRVGQATLRRDLAKQSTTEQMQRVLDARDQLQEQEQAKEELQSSYEAEGNATMQMAQELATARADLDAREGNLTAAKAAAEEAQAANAEASAAAAKAAAEKQAAEAEKVKADAAAAILGLAQEKQLLRGKLSRFAVRDAAA